MSVQERPIPTVSREALDPLLSSGAFARRSRLSMKALRLYNRQGLLTPDRVDSGNGYRWYRESQLVTARLIAMLRRLDMPLSEVAAVVSAAAVHGTEVGMLRRLDVPLTQVSDGAPAARPRAVELLPSRAAAELVSSYWEAVERRVASQRALAAHLQIRLLGQEGSFGMFDIQQRDAPEQLVLTEQRHVQVPELSRWIGEAIGRLAQSAQRYGGVVAPIFVIYHGEVNQDSDGPVEVCVPISLAQPASADSAMRREPAHREAYVRITKAQVEYPQILSAFDAVAEWLSAQGRTSAGPPREVYFTDFMSASPTDEVCDVAFPIG